MATDLTQVTAEQTPPRHVLIAEHLREVDPTQLAALDTNDQAYYNHIYDNLSGEKPLAPTSLAVADQGGQEVEVTWTDAGAASDSWVIYYLDDAAGTEDAATIVSTGTLFSGTEDPAGTAITGLTGGTDVGVIVAGVNEAGQGPYAGPVFEAVAV